MTDRELAEIVLVRSVEESDPEYFAPDVLLEALRMTGGAANDTDLISRRAHYLYSRLPDSLIGIPASISSSLKWSVPGCIGLFLLGVIVNYLGPGDKIHILSNPVVLLISWNVVVFVLFFARYFFVRKNTTVHAPTGGAQKASISSGPPLEREYPPQPAVYTSLPSRWLIRKLWFALHTQFAKKKQDIKKMASRVKVKYRFMEHWWNINHTVYFARSIRLTHLFAISLVLGALAGIYMRGLFFEYNVVWKSTFIHDPGKIALILNIIFGIPSWLINGAFIEESGISLLTAAAGAPAASWIHLFALSALLYVVPERMFLIFLESGRIQSALKKRSVDLDEPYYARFIRHAQEMQASRLRDETFLVVTRQTARLAESVAAFVRDSLYDTHIVPLFISFRNNGGRIRDLESTIEGESEKFRDTLNGFLESAQDDFKESISEGVSRIIGRKLADIEVDVGKNVHVDPETFKEALDQSVTKNMTDAISIAVTAAVAATAGTISGGFGKVLGIAIVSAILHTSGPVGFLIGALAGLLLGGGAAVIAKDRITDAVKDRTFPAFSTRMLFSESKLNSTIEEGRAGVYKAIRTEVERKLTSQTEEITKQILSRIAIPSGNTNL